MSTVFTTISVSRPQTVASVPLPRDISIDYLRSFVIVLVVLLHAMMSYTTYLAYIPGDYARSSVAVADPQRFWLFDIVSMYIYSFMMPLLFLLSGLFVRTGLERRGVGGFLLARIRRLGVPFLVFAFLLGPLALWPEYLQSTTPDLAPYWIRTYTDDGWPVGPGWFLWVLLVFDAVAALLYGWAPRVLDRLVARPTAPVFIVAATLAYAPLFPYISPETWVLNYGPFDFQPAKLLLYFVYFLMGVGLSGAKSWQSRSWPRHPSTWLAGGTAAFIAYFATIVLNLGPNPSRLMALGCGIAAALTAAILSIGLLGAFHRRARARWPIAGSLADNSFGIYVLHYPVVVWLQYLALPLPWNGGLKGLAVLAIALTLSWGASAVLRRIPGVRQFI